MNNSKNKIVRIIMQIFIIVYLIYEQEVLSFVLGSTTILISITNTVIVIDIVTSSRPNNGSTTTIIVTCGMLHCY